MTLERERQIGRLLLILRITLALYLMQWGIGMLVDPLGWTKMFQADYGVVIASGNIWIVAIFELAIVAMFLAGYRQKLSYALAFFLGFLSTAASIDVLLKPYSGDPMAQLAGLPVVAALWLIIGLRGFDIYSVDHFLNIRRAGGPDRPAG